MEQFMEIIDKQSSFNLKDIINFEENESLQPKQKEEKLTLKEIIKKDMYRYDEVTSLKDMIKCYIQEPGANYMVWFRIAQKYNNIFTKIILRRKMFKFGMEIYPSTDIGKGFYIGHFGGIVINPKSKIGKNCNISQNVTIGASNRGICKGYPVIGDNVFIGPGAVIVGNITIGDNVAIGANAVVTKSFEANSVIVGVPARLISTKGSIGYINNKA
jgi:serine O-acetyltransferase